MGECILHGNGGGSGLNFRVIGGTSTPASPRENDIWVNTDTAVTGWHFGTDEPNVYNIQLTSPGDIHRLLAPHKLSEGDILNFIIPATVIGAREAIRVYDPFTGKEYCVREFNGTALQAWPSGVAVGVVISNDLYQIGEWVGDGTARLFRWEAFYHNEGTVWITTGTSSPSAFNALKKNSLMVYPLSAKQCIGGSWVVKEASIYQSGEWVQFSSYWDGYYFKDGDQYEEITGGWTSEGWDNSATATIGETLIVRANGNATGRMGIANPVDLTNVNTLWYDSPNGNNGASNSGYLCIANAKTYGSGNRVASVTIRKAGTGSIDVSNLSGEHYLYLYAMGSSGATAYADIRAIWGE